MPSRLHRFPLLIAGCKDFFSLPLCLTVYALYCFCTNVDSVVMCIMNSWPIGESCFTEVASLSYCNCRGDPIHCESCMSIFITLRNLGFCSTHCVCYLARFSFCSCLSFLGHTRSFRWHWCCRGIWHVPSSHCYISILKYAGEDDTKQWK